MTNVRTVVHVYNGARVVAQPQRDSAGDLVDISVDIDAQSLASAPLRLYLSLGVADELRDQLTEALARARARSAPRNGGDKPAGQ